MTVASISRAKELYDGTAHIVGQEKARRSLAVLLERQHFVAMDLLDRSYGAIVAGRTGTGKTYLAKTMAKLSGLPFADVNATQFTDKGYVGADLAQMFVPLLQDAARILDEARGHKVVPHGFAGYEEVEPAARVLQRDDLGDVVELAERGVVLLDEFDKWMIQGQDVQGRNVGRKLQAELLKMVEGDTEYVSDDEDELGTPIDTSKILVICCGAFVGLPAMVLRRLQRDEEYMNDEGFWSLIEPADFVRYGVLPELAGRLPYHIFMTPLREEHLAGIMRQKGGIVEEYRGRFNALGIEWEVPDVALQHLAYIALSKEMGARAVEHVMAMTFADALFEASVARRPMIVRYEVGRSKAWLEAA